MISSRDVAFAFTLSTEGKLSLDPKDGGNYASGIAGRGPLIGSNFGVSAAQLVRYLEPEVVTAKTMAAITKDTAEAIWTPGYWTALACDQLVGGLDLMVCDHGYNRGAPASARVLQALCGAQADGWIGDETVAAANGWLTQTHSFVASAPSVRRVQAMLGVAADGQIGPTTANALRAAGSLGAAMMGLAQLADAQLADYRQLAKFSIYGRGWTTRALDRLASGLLLLPTSLRPQEKPL